MMPRQLRILILLLVCTVAGCQAQYTGKAPTKSVACVAYNSATPSQYGVYCHSGSIYSLTGKTQPKCVDMPSSITSFSGKYDKGYDGSKKNCDDIWPASGNGGSNGYLWMYYCPTVTSSSMDYQWYASKYNSTYLTNLGLDDLSSFVCDTTSATGDAMTLYSCSNYCATQLASGPLTVTQLTTPTATKKSSIDVMDVIFTAITYVPILGEVYELTESIVSLIENENDVSAWLTLSFAVVGLASFALSGPLEAAAEVLSEAAYIGSEYANGDVTKIWNTLNGVTYSTTSPYATVSSFATDKYAALAYMEDQFNPSEGYYSYCTSFSVDSTVQKWDSDSDHPYYAASFYRGAAFHDLIFHLNLNSYLTRASIKAYIKQQLAKLFTTANASGSNVQLKLAQAYYLGWKARYASCHGWGITYLGLHYNWPSVSSVSDYDPTVTLNSYSDAVMPTSSSATVRGLWCGFSHLSTVSDGTEALYNSIIPCNGYEPHIQCPANFQQRFICDVNAALTTEIGPCESGFYICVSAAVDTTTGASAVTISQSDLPNGAICGFDARRYSDGSLIQFGTYATEATDFFEPCVVGTSTPTTGTFTCPSGWTLTKMCDIIDSNFCSTEGAYRQVCAYSGRSSPLTTSITSTLPQGTWCGVRDTMSEFTGSGGNIQCNGATVTSTSCPSGYIAYTMCEQYINTCLQGKRICMKDDFSSATATAGSASTPTLHGLMCGWSSSIINENYEIDDYSSTHSVKFSRNVRNLANTYMPRDGNHAGAGNTAVQLCQGYDPYYECPVGYVQRTFCDMQRINQTQTARSNGGYIYTYHQTSIQCDAVWVTCTLGTQNATAKVLLQSNHVPVGAMCGYESSVKQATTVNSDNIYTAAGTYDSSITKSVACTQSRYSVNGGSLTCPDSTWTKVTICDDVSNRATVKNGVSGDWFWTWESGLTYAADCSVTWSTCVKTGSANSKVQIAALPDGMLCGLDSRYRTWSSSGGYTSYTSSYNCNLGSSATIGSYDISMAETGMRYNVCPPGFSLASRPDASISSQLIGVYSAVTHCVKDQGISFVNRDATANSNDYWIDKINGTIYANTFNKAGSACITNGWQSCIWGGGNEVGELNTALTASTSTWLYKFPTTLYCIKNLLDNSYFLSPHTQDDTYWGTTKTACILSTYGTAYSNCKTYSSFSACTAAISSNSGPNTTPNVLHSSGPNFASLRGLMCGWHHTYTGSKTSNLKSGLATDALVQCGGYDPALKCPSGFKQVAIGDTNSASGQSGSSPDGIAGQVWFTCASTHSQGGTKIDPTTDIIYGSMCGYMKYSDTNANIDGRYKGMVSTYIPCSVSNSQDSTATHGTYSGAYLRSGSNLMEGNWITSVNSNTRMYFTSGVLSVQQRSGATSSEDTWTTSWSVSKTVSANSFRWLTLQGDGNLVWYEAKRNAIYPTTALTFMLYYLFLTNAGRIVVTDGVGGVKWAAPVPGVTGTPTSVETCSGNPNAMSSTFTAAVDGKHHLASGSYLISCNSKYKMQVAPNGQVLVYIADDVGGYALSYTWFSPVSGSNSAFGIVLNTYGQVSQYGDTSALWASGTVSSSTSFTLEVLDTGFLTLYNAAWKDLWTQPSGSAADALIAGAMKCPDANWRVQVVCDNSNLLTSSSCSGNTCSLTYKGNNCDHAWATCVYVPPTTPSPSFTGRTDPVPSGALAGVVPYINSGLSGAFSNISPTTTAANKATADPVNCNCPTGWSCGRRCDDSGDGCWTNFVQHCYKN